MFESRKCDVIYLDGGWCPADVHETLGRIVDNMSVETADDRSVMLEWLITWAKIELKKESTLP